MDCFELLLADRLRALAREMRFEALLVFKADTVRAFSYHPTELQILFEQWEAENPIDAFLPKALNELIRISGFVKGNR